MHYIGTSRICSWNKHTNIRKYDGNIIISGNSMVSGFARLLRETQTTIEVEEPSLTPEQRETISTSLIMR